MTWRASHLSTGKVHQLGGVSGSNRQAGELEIAAALVPMFGRAPRPPHIRSDRRSASLANPARPWTTGRSSYRMHTSDGQDAIGSTESTVSWRVRDTD